MKARTFIHQLDENAIVSAIAAAEHQTSSEIRVYIDHAATPEALAEAERLFVRLGMTKTQLRNAVLIYLAPATQQFAVIGDEGVHSRCGSEFWQELVSAMSQTLKQGLFTQAIVDCITQVGQRLAKHFPRAAQDRNELPNTIATNRPETGEPPTG